MQTPYDGILKVGLTKREVVTRASELSSQTGVIGKFTLLKSYEVPVEIVEVIEKQSHKHLKSENLHHSKEYFKATLRQCELAVEQALVDTNAHELLRKIKEEDKAKKDSASDAMHQKQTALVTAFNNENKLLIASINENFLEFKLCIEESRKITFTQSLFSKKDESLKFTRRKNELKLILAKQQNEFMKSERDFMNSHKLSHRNFFTSLGGNTHTTFSQFEKLIKMGW